MALVTTMCSLKADTSNGNAVMSKGYLQRVGVDGAAVDAAGVQSRYDCFTRYVFRSPCQSTSPAWSLDVADSDTNPSLSGGCKESSIGVIIDPLLVQRTHTCGV